MAGAEREMNMATSTMKAIPNQLIDSDEDQPGRTTSETVQDHSTEVQPMSDRPIKPQNSEAMKKEYPDPQIISSYEWDPAGSHDADKNSSATSCADVGGRNPTQGETEKLQKAIKSGDTFTIESMIKQDLIDVNAKLLPMLPYYVPDWAWKYFFGYSPLMCAVEEGKLSSVQILVQLGADIMKTATKIFGGKITPPERAVENNLIDVVYYFVAKHKLDVSKFHTSYHKTVRAMVKQYEEAHPEVKNPETSQKRQNSDLVISHHTLGEGKWGRINEATFKGQQVAAKFLDESRMSLIIRENIRREKNILAKCKHVNLVRFVGAFSSHPTTIMVFELMDWSLKVALEKQKIILDHVHPICLDVANGLSYLHNFQPNALMHRNVGNSNILLKADGTNWIAKLSDFSLAQFINDASQGIESASHSIYSAPEMFNERLYYLQTTKVDIFSYGVLFAETLLLGLPHSTVSELITAVQPQWPHHAAFLHLCTSKNPDDRPNINIVISTVSGLRDKTTSSK